MYMTHRASTLAALDTPDLIREHGTLLVHAIYSLVIAVTSVMWLWLHRQYSLRPPTEGWPGSVGLGALVKYQDGIPANGHPS